MPIKIGIITKTATIVIKEKTQKMQIPQEHKLKNKVSLEFNEMNKDKKKRKKKNEGLNKSQQL